MAIRDEVREESILMRLFTFERAPTLLDEGYGLVAIRIGLLLFAALLFRMILLETELQMVWALVALGFSLLVSLLLMLALDYLTKLHDTSKLLIFGVGMAVLTALIMIVPLL